MSFTPDGDANYQKFLAKRATLSAEDAADFTEHCLKYLIEQATAGTLASAHITTQSNMIDNAKTATKAKKHTY